MRRTLVCLLTALAIAAIAAPAVSASPTRASRLFVLDASGGTLVPAGGEHFTLTLRGVQRHATWFTDRPARQAGTLPLATLAAGWAALGFVKDPPNAAIEVAAAKATEDTLIVELGRPRYDARHDTLAVRVRRLDPATRTLGGHERRADRSIPRRFGSTSLFIDNAGARELDLTIRNDSRAALTIVTSDLTGGQWSAPPFPGTTIEPSGQITLADTSPSPWIALGGALGLAPVDGGLISLQWSWPVGTMPTGTAQSQSVNGLLVTTSLPATSYDTATMQVVVTDAGR